MGYSSPEKRREAYATKCRNGILAANAAWQLANAEKYKASQASHYAENREKKLAYQRAYYLLNKEKVREYKSEYHVQNREILRVIYRNKKARRKSAEGHHTIDDINRIRGLQCGKCAYCRVSLKSGEHVDHITALVNGGSNWPGNLQLLCEPCNLSKHAKDPIVFAQQIGLLL